MLERRARGQLEFFVCGSLRDLIPDDHLLARIDGVLDLSWLHDEVAEVYALGVGRPAIEPEAAVRLMLAGFLLGIVHDRRLMREAQVNIAIRWFAGFGMNDRLPDHSSLTRIRQRWGAERFRRIFERTVQACVAAGIAKGEIVHVDASLIRADVSWESLAIRHVGAVETANGDDAADPQTGSPRRNSKKTGKVKKVSLTDPDASMATTARNRRLEPSYKQHSVVDDERGVVLDLEVTTGEVNEGEQMLARLDAAAAVTGTPIATVTADAGYAYGKIFGGLERRSIAAFAIGLERMATRWLTPHQGRTDPQPRAAATVPLRSVQRHRQMPAGQDPAPRSAGEARAVLPFAPARLRPLRSRCALSLEGTHGEVGGDRR
jgi:transposase